jgi:succinate--hydroxymethylglutarate CoA-transferase
MTRVLAGPYCTMVLGDMGADVIKIERPKIGDETRAWGPPFKEGESAYFLSVNRNKRSITVDLKSDQGKKIMMDLVGKCDVLVENYIPGTLDRMGYGYSDLKNINPRLIYCSLTGFGADGPYATRPGYDVVLSAMGGLMGVTGPSEAAQAPGSPPASPVKVGVAITDVATGLHAHGAILAALYKRTRTHKGQKIDLSLLEVQVAAMVNLASNWLVSGVDGKRWGSEHPSIVP